MVRLWIPLAVFFSCRLSVCVSSHLEFWCETATVAEMSIIEVVRTRLFCCSNTEGTLDTTWSFSARSRNTEVGDLAVILL